MAGEEDDAKQRLQRFIHSLDWAALTTLEQLIKTRKKTLKLSRELEASLQEEWDTEHPDGVNGMRRVFKVVAVSSARPWCAVYGNAVGSCRCWFGIPKALPLAGSASRTARLCAPLLIGPD
jgi:hypothetical protein